MSIGIFFEDEEDTMVSICFKLFEKNKSNLMCIEYTVEWNEECLKKCNLKKPSGSINSYQERTMLVSQLQEGVEFDIEDEQLFQYQFDRKGLNEFLDNYCIKHNLKRSGIQMWTKRNFLNDQYLLDAIMDAFTDVELECF